jgi:glycosyltransferase involved in cell wall biosynthesis
MPDQTYKSTVLEANVTSATPAISQSANSTHYADARIPMTKTAKIVHMTSNHSALDGRIFHKECRSLARAGFDVTVVGLHTEDTVRDTIQIKSIPRNPSRFRRMTQTTWSVYRRAIKENADVYHFHDAELIPAGLLLRAHGKQVIYDIHEDMPAVIMSRSYLPKWSRGIVAHLAAQLEKIAARRLTALVPERFSVAERFYPYNRRTVIVHNFPYPSEIVHGHNSSPWESREQSVAYVGGISRIRAIREMVSAMALVPKHLQANLELAGNEIPDDVKPEELRQNAGWTSVRHHGWLDQPSAFRLLYKVRAGLVLFYPEPNHRESMPTKIFEYMGAGLPVIASDFPLWRKILGKTECAIFVDPKNPQEIAKAIEYILTHPKEAEEMGRRGQAAMLAEYCWDSEARKLIDLYRELTSANCPD